MKNHPYTSKTFLDTWQSHFRPHQKTIALGYFKGPLFHKKKYPPIFVNAGSNFTLQNYYQIDSRQNGQLQKKVVTILDVPDYFNIPQIEHQKMPKQHIVREYVGFLIDLKDVGSLESYMTQRFSSKSKSKFRSYLRKLEKTFIITYAMYFGHIEKENYDFIMDAFFSISKRSFKIKNITNKKLLPKNFAFIKDVTYKLILEKKANLFVIYDRGNPIGISLNYNSDNILFGDSTVYDPDYSKYNIGIIMLIKQLEWCIANDIEIYDFSKAYFDYKAKWCNRSYHFRHHIFYDSKHLKSTLVAGLFALFLRTKQYLREHPFRTYLIRKGIIGKKPIKEMGYSQYSGELNDLIKGEVPLDLNKHPHLFKAINDFVHSSAEHVTAIQVFPIINEANLFCIKGNKTERIVSVDIR